MRQRYMAAAAVVVSSLVGTVWGQAVLGPATRPVMAADAPATAPATAPAAEDRPLMAWLTSIGVAQPLKDYSINIYGFIENSYTYNFAGANKSNFGRVFDQQSNQFLMNQLDLTVERVVNVTKDKWDIGGRMEWIYGADSRFIHSNGLFDHETDEYQVDLNQAYLDVAVPVGNGLRVRVGKIVTLLGYETINPTSNPFYSHSYLFGFAIPFTHTGVMGTYQINDNWLVEGGIFRGWEQSIDDNNGSISYHLKLGYTSTDKKLSGIVQAVTGPEAMDDNEDYRTVFDFQLSYAFTDKFTLAANADFGWESSAAPDGGTAYWYGIANYASYVLNDTCMLNGRAEWFRDEEGVRIGVAGNYYEVTLGTTITPFPNDRTLKNLVIRPEFRADFSGEPVFNDHGDHEMYTAAVDVIFKF